MHAMHAPCNQDLKFSMHAPDHPLAADEDCHIDKTQFSVPFVCGCRDLGEGLRRIAEGGALSIYLKKRHSQSQGTIQEQGSSVSDCVNIHKAQLLL